MVKYIALAALILTAGCASNNNVSTKQATPQPAKITTHSHSQSRSTDPASIKTQASSTSTDRIGKLSAKGTQDGITSELLDLIQAPAGSPANQAPGGTPANRGPAGAPVNQGPTNAPTNKPPAGTPADQEPIDGTNGQAGRSAAGNGTAGTGAQTPASGKDSTQFAQQVLDLVNKERSKAGLGSLSMDDELSKMAMAKAQDMYNNNYFDHNSPTHGSPFDMMKEYGITYQSAGENIAKGQTTPTQVMNDWMNSPGHKANILNKSFTKIGIAFYNNEWVQEFTG
ncbi:Cysteine-rich secretory protein family protein [Paenibacillus sp. P1XP2]|nr:Cysteine-rich secretory protein family protein [Paenibacillus sp. P1XP2]